MHAYEDETFIVTTNVIACSLVCSGAPQTGDDPYHLPHTTTATGAIIRAINESTEALTTAELWDACRVRNILVQCYLFHDNVLLMHIR